VLSKQLRGATEHGWLTEGITVIGRKTRRVKKKTTANVAKRIVLQKRVFFGVFPMFVPSLSR
jgi:hypothetical protein